MKEDYKTLADRLVERAKEFKIAERPAPCFTLRDDGYYIGLYESDEADRICFEGLKGITALIGAGAEIIRLDDEEDASGCYLHKVFYQGYFFQMITRKPLFTYYKAKWNRF
ncbi:MAG: hypothetical protein AABY07_08295 [Nanoarchaeota archaeon]